MEAAAIGAPHAHDATTTTTGRRAANRSSRVEPQLLGMLLFIISEIMVFGAFFTAYFFIRVVDGRRVVPGDGLELPVAVAGVNTAILRLLVAHAALGARRAIKHGNRFGLQGRHARDVPARRDVPLHPDQRVRPPRLRPAATTPRARSSTASPACTARTSSSA